MTHRVAPSARGSTSSPVAVDPAPDAPAARARDRCRELHESRRRLEADGLIEGRGAELRTTRRWQAAMARAAYQSVAAGESSSDLRVPMVRALLEFYPELPDPGLATLLEVLLPAEVRALEPNAVEPERTVR